MRIYFVSPQVAWVLLWDTDSDKKSIQLSSEPLVIYAKVVENALFVLLYVHVFT